MANDSGDYVECDLNTCEQCAESRKVVAPWEDVIHLCDDGPMHRPHTMGVRRDGKFVEVRGEWDGSSWVNLRTV